MEQKKKVYLAGWDVFRANSIEFGKKLQKHCEENNLIGLYPLDNQVPEDVKTPREIAAWIYEANINLIKQADIIMANVNSFRGAEPDSGTAFEIGFAHALNKPVYIYMDNTLNMADRLAQENPEYATDNKWVDKAGLTVENFDFPVNLMLSVPSIIFQGSALECIEKINADVNTQYKNKFKR